MVFWWILLTLLWIEASPHSPNLTTTSEEQCFGSRVELVCTHPDPFDDPDNYLPQVLNYAENGTTIDITDPANARFTPTWVNSTVSKLSFNITEEDQRDGVISYTCFLVRNNANRDHDESEALVLDPPEKPKAPVITSLPSNSSNLIRWTHDSSNKCYSNHTFGFNLTWTKMADPPDPPSSGSNLTTDTQYDFSSLPRGEYSVSIQAQSIEDPSILSDVTSIRISLTALSSPGTTTPSTDPPADWTVLIIIVVVLVSIVIAILILVGFICVCVRSKRSMTLPTHEPGGVSQNPPKDNLYGRVTYAELEHSQYRPVAAPSQGSVEYTSAVQVGKHPPRAVLPSFKGAPEKDDKEFCRQDSNKSDEFKIQVVTVLRQVVRAPRTSGENVLGNYKQATFVAIFVYIEEESQNVSEEDVEKVAIAKSRHRTDKGLLFSNTEFIQSSLIGKLEKNGCHFISLHTSDKEEVTEEMLMKKFDLFFT